MENKWQLFKLVIEGKYDMYLLLIFITTTWYPGIPIVCKYVFHCTVIKLFLIDILSFKE